MSIECCTCHYNPPCNFCVTTRCPICGRGGVKNEEQDVCDDCTAHGLSLKATEAETMGEVSIAIPNLWRSLAEAELKAFDKRDAEDHEAWMVRESLKLHEALLFHGMDCNEFYSVKWPGKSKFVVGKFDGMEFFVETLYHSAKLYSFVLCAKCGNPIKSDELKSVVDILRFERGELREHHYCQSGQKTATELFLDSLHDYVYEIACEAIGNQ